MEILGTLDNSIVIVSENEVFSVCLNASEEERERDIYVSLTITSEFNSDGNELSNLKILLSIIIFNSQL